MKKSILNIGKALNKNEQKQIDGGWCGLCSCESRYNLCLEDSYCSGSQVCHEGRCMCPEDIP